MGEIKKFKNNYNNSKYYQGFYDKYKYKELMVELKEDLHQAISKDYNLTGEELKELLEYITIKYYDTRMHTDYIEWLLEGVKKCVGTRCIGRSDRNDRGI